MVSRVALFFSFCWLVLILFSLCSWKVSDFYSQCWLGAKIFPEPSTNVQKVFPEHVCWFTCSTERKMRWLLFVHNCSEIGLPTLRGHPSRPVVLFVQWQVEKSTAWSDRNWNSVSFWRQIQSKCFFFLYTAQNSLLSSLCLVSLTNVQSLSSGSSWGGSCLLHLVQAENSKNVRGTRDMVVSVQLAFICHSGESLQSCPAYRKWTGLFHLVSSLSTGKVLLQVYLYRNQQAKVSLSLQWDLTGCVAFCMGHARTCTADKEPSLHWKHVSLFERRRELRM